MNVEPERKHVKVNLLTFALSPSNYRLPTLDLPMALPRSSPPVHAMRFKDCTLGVERFAEAKHG